MRSTLIAPFVLLTVSAAAFAQEATFDPAASGLKPGDKIYVVVERPCTADQCPGEWVKGTVMKLSDASMALWDGGTQHDLPARTIQRVERPPDRIWNGMLIGFGAGFAFGFISVMANPCDPHEWCILGDGPGLGTAIGLFTGGIGAGIGTVTDLLIGGERVVFQRAGRGPRATFAPVIAPTRVAATLRVTF